MKSSIIIVSTVSLLVLAGCGTSKPLSRDFGNATAHNKGVQIVDPEASASAPTYDGSNTAEAIKRYHTGTVEQPEKVSTDKSASGG